MALFLMNYKMGSRHAWREMAVSSFNKLLVCGGTEKSKEKLGEI